MSCFLTKVFTTHMNKENVWVRANGRVLLELKHGILLVISIMCEMTVLSKLILERCVINSCHCVVRDEHKVNHQNLFHKLFLQQSLSHIVSPQMEAIIIIFIKHHHYYSSLSDPTVLAARKGGVITRTQRSCTSHEAHQPGWEVPGETLKSAFQQGK